MEARVCFLVFFVVKFRSKSILISFLVFAVLTHFYNFINLNQAKLTHLRITNVVSEMNPSVGLVFRYSEYPVEGVGADRYSRKLYISDCGFLGISAAARAVVKNIRSPL